MPLIVRAFPVLAGKEEAAIAFADEVGTRQDTAAFFQRHGIRRESWHLQRTPSGAVIIVITDVEGPPLERAAGYQNSQASYELWFKDRVRELSGIDPDTQPLGPPTQTIFSYDSENRRKSFDSPVPG